jgi:hypothetical protein
MTEVQEKAEVGHDTPPRNRHERRTQAAQAGRSPNSRKHVPIDAKLTYTIREFTEVSGLGPTKTYELIKDGRLKVIKIDGRTLITAASARALLGAE